MCSAIADPSGIIRIYYCFLTPARSHLCAKLTKSTSSMVSSTNLVVCLLTSALSLYKTEAFAGQKGWTNRPVFPELAKTPDAEVETSSAKKEKWDLMRFLSQSSKFISMPKPPLPGANRPIPIIPGELIWSSASGAVNGVDSSSGDKPKMNFNFAPLDDVVMGGGVIFHVHKWKMVRCSQRQ